MLALGIADEVERLGLKGNKKKKGKKLDEDFTVRATFYGHKLILIHFSLFYGRWRKRMYPRS